jgi:hypothetical protein
MVNTLKCAICGKPAMAYSVEKDGRRTGLCFQHIPTHDVDQPYAIVFSGRHGSDGQGPQSASDPMERS